MKREEEIRRFFITGGAGVIGSYIVEHICLGGVRFSDNGADWAGVEMRPRSDL